MSPEDVLHVSAETCKAAPPAVCVLSEIGGRGFVCANRRRIHKDSKIRKSSGKPNLHPLRALKPWNGTRGLKNHGRRLQ
ncbi:hypothetical protein SUGI_0829340 [Cryptomeria japonica]|nr:hypothetical protein SUGI_0829340 [Cryptomeria japonica]